jgi:hypothetical protein
MLNFGRLGKANLCMSLSMCSGEEYPVILCLKYYHGTSLYNSYL